MHDDIEDIYQLSPAQEGMLFHTLYGGESGVYFEQLSCLLEGQLDAAAFQIAWQRVVDRYPALRTSFHWADLEKPLQVVHRSVQLPWEVHEWTHLDHQQQTAELERFLTTDRERGFSLEQPPLMRCALIRVGEHAHRFIWSHHHILFDGWSFAILLTDVLAEYRALCAGEELSAKQSLPFRNYISWLQQQDRGPAEAFWREELAEMSAPTVVPLGSTTERHLPQPRNFRQQLFRLPETKSSVLRSFARTHHLTLNTLMQGALALLLHRYTGAAEVLFGVTVSGRPSTLPDVEAMVGLFVNTVPARLRVVPDAKVMLWLTDLQQRQALRADYAYTPLVDIQGWSDIPRGTPLFETLLVFENYPKGSSLTQETAGLVFSDVQGIERTNYPLAIAVTPELEVVLRIVYDAERFEAAVIQRLAGHLFTLLEDMAASPDRPLSALRLLTEAESRQLLADWNNTAAAYPVDQCLHQLFEAQAARTPEAAAVRYDGEVLTYCSLDVQANRWAHYLRSLGVGPGTPVGLCVERSLDLVVGLLAILKTGGAYVPLDPDYPSQRLAFMLQDVRAPVLVTQQRLRPGLPPFQGQVVCLDADQHAIAHQPTTPPIQASSAQDLAYVIYTSGSTGQPRGVCCHHAGVINLLTDFQQRQTLSEGDGCSWHTSLSFDVSVYEIFSALTSGATLDIVPEAVRPDGMHFGQWLADRRISSAYIPPFMLADFAQWLDTAPNRPPLRRLLVGVEPINEHLLAQINRCLPATRIINGYGPTETTICCTLFDVAPERATDRRTPIGRPPRNTQLYVLDQLQRLVPIGVPGELYVGGHGLAHGYLNRPELTAERFLANPFSAEAGARMYRTGDIVRYLEDGNLVFIGRTDNQVKLRGFRIELGEIEAVLCQHPAVRQAAVVSYDNAGDKTLVGYVVPQNPTLLSARTLYDHCRRYLPLYMVPSVFQFIDELPISPNGKTDRRRLPILDLAGAETGEEFVAPRDELEQKLADIWVDVLQRQEIGIYDNFFEAGGHSLRAMHVVSRVYSALQVEVPLRLMFESPTIASMATAIRQIHGGAAPQQASDPQDTEIHAASLSPALVPIKPHGRGTPIFCIHPASGVVFPYYSLAKWLENDRPLYGIQDPSVDGGRAPYDSIEEMASDYIEAVRQIQPHGPYHLAGWSLGGIVAFEMAQQLAKQGETTGLLGILDTPVPIPSDQSAQPLVVAVREFVRQSRIVLAMALASIPHFLNGLYLLVASAFRRRQVDANPPRLRERLQWLWLRAWHARLLRQAGLAGYVDANRDLLLIELPALRRILRTLRHHLEVGARYVPDTYAGKAVLFRAKQSLAGDVVSEPDMGWSRLAMGGVEVYSVPGNHVAMLNEPYVRDLAHAVTESLLKTEDQVPKAPPADRMDAPS